MAYTMEDLLSVLHPYGPVKVDALSKNCRRVEHGLTTWDLRSTVLATVVISCISLMLWAGGLR